MCAEGESYVAGRKGPFRDHRRPAHRRPRRRRRRHACPQVAHAVAPLRRTVSHRARFASRSSASNARLRRSATAAAVAALAASARDVAVLGGGGARSPAARARRATSLASATEGLLPPALAIRCSTASTGASKKLLTSKLTCMSCVRLTSASALRIAASSLAFASSPPPPPRSRRPPSSSTSSPSCCHDLAGQPSACNTRRTQPKQPSSMSCNQRAKTLASTFPRSHASRSYLLTYLLTYSAAAAALLTYSLYIYRVYLLTTLQIYE